jgi:nitrite reductase/ring-hydroxylating ferredoxin subunit
MRTARRLEANGQVIEVPLDAVANEVLSGGIFLVRECLRPEHLLSIRRISLEMSENVAGCAEAEALRSRGFSEIHQIVTPGVLMKVADAIQREIERIVPDVLRDISTNILLHKQPFHYERHPNVRFHVPFDVWKPHKSEYEEYARDHGEGKLSPHDPHRDGWYRCPENAINIWVAVGRVERGNGMSLYPDVYDRPVRRSANGRIEHGQPLGQRVNFELEPGEALIFHGKHLHSSELNHTHNTRYVVSFRITLTRPRVSVLSNHKYLWSRYDKGLLGSGLALGEKILRNGEALFRAGTLEPGAALEPVRDLTATKADGETLRIPSSAVIADNLLPLPNRLAATRIDGRVVVFRRTCPHSGGDLAMGSVRGAELLCPEHNLPFDLRTGRSPCKSLTALRFLPCSECDGEIAISLAPVASNAPTQTNEQEPVV